MKFNVLVKSGSRKSEIRFEDGVYFVKVKSRAEEGKANLELIKLFKKKFKKDVRIVSGFKSRKKVLEIV